MKSLIREQGVLAMELHTTYFPVIYNSKAIANLQYLDGKYCAAELENEMPSILTILLEMKQGVN